MFPHDHDSLATIARGLPITFVNFPNYKTGANRHDVIKISKLSADGMKLSEIAHELHILEAGVKVYLPKRKRRTPEEMAEAS